jgi:hypothetical protein
MLHWCVFAGVRGAASMLLHLETRYAAVLTRNNKTMSNIIVLVSFEQQFNITYEYYPQYTVTN